ncbi:hypothetical protein NJF44_13900 [Pseudomonas guariconensis]|uniref:hypothetical protein n=1 Tax=Pseudomonas TaxID=286 RepID=UPI0020985776|nr:MULTISPECIES: hypothetical protein [Pseudomonas]MCO7516322.1 hypothetical protein [Pseudomonas putida]MCO7606330.1 hypothetical protein [Pseudomonas guariconensis]
MGDDRVGIGHLRQALGGHERCDLHVPHTGLVGHVDPFQLRGGGHDAAKALQAIAHADFVQGDVVHAGPRREEVLPA